MSRVMILQLSCLSRIAKNVVLVVMMSVVAVINKLYWFIRYRVARPQLLEIIYVDPNQITRMVTGHIPFKNCWNEVRGGEWDQQTCHGVFHSQRQIRKTIQGSVIIDLAQYSFFAAVREHFIDGVAWEDTDFYRYKVSANETGMYAPGKLKDRMKYLDSLYEDIAGNGYKSQRMICENVSLKQRLLNIDTIFPGAGEVKVVIARDGEILFRDGRHRLAIAQVAGLGQIPVRIVARHKMWQKKRMLAARQQGEVPNPHPDIS